MKTHDESKLNTTERNSDTCQANAKTPRRVRSGFATTAYWRRRLYRNTYRDRQGRQVEIPEYYVRMRYNGITKQVRLNYSEQDKAAEEALKLFLRVQEEGMAAVTARQGRLPSSPTVEEYCVLYQTATASMERAPRPISVATYLRSLRQICSYAEIKLLRELNREAIENARDAYRSKARREARSEVGIQNTLAKILRNAAACFSSEIRGILARKGLVIENPFLSIRRTQDIQPVSPLPQTIVEAIWRELPLLRDGDSHAHDPVQSRFARKYRKAHSGRKPRWLPVDFRQAHPDAYAVILLALGTGLRANEIDKARWSWLGTDAKGDPHLEIRPEDDFLPKGGTLRRIRIPAELYSALVATRKDMSSPYVIGGEASPAKAAKGECYRRPNVFRAVNTWLRARGVETDVPRGHPLHRLRKQFGSELATHHGLFAAQKLLGHSSPTVTAKYYAAQTELPTLTHVRIMG